jgi:hypothetical protein
MILGQLPLRAMLINKHVEAEPGGSRGTVVIVRTRVGYLFFAEVSFIRRN